MADLQERGDTPPQHPIYGVDLSVDTITSIVRKCLPHLGRHFSVEKLHHSRSWNNRIYILSSTEQVRTERYVLKLSGRHFGPAKVSNEVISLWLLNQFCETLPIPRVVAWSPDGSTIFQGIENTPSMSLDTESGKESNQSGWILMTCLPGDSLDPSTLTFQEKLDIAEQVGAIVLEWRRSIPKSKYCGNFHLHPSNLGGTSDAISRPRTGELKFEVSGLLDIGCQSTTPIDSLLSFWQTKLSWAINTLCIEEVFAANRKMLLGPLQEFVRAGLPSLSLFARDNESSHGFVFSHTDLSPRNVLISGSPPSVTGVVDFEFSGFFPLLQDFTGKSIISTKDDHEGWPDIMHMQILRRLNDAGEVTPVGMEEVSQWKELHLLTQLETFIAPWWLSEITKGEDMEAELKQARDNVERILSDLNSCLS